MPDGTHAGLGLETEQERTVYAEALDRVLDTPAVLARIGVRPAVTTAAVRHAMISDPRRVERVLGPHGRFLLRARRCQSAARGLYREYALAAHWVRAERRARSRGGRRPGWWRAGSLRLRGCVASVVLLVLAFAGSVLPLGLLAGAVLITLAAGFSVADLELRRSTLEQRLTGLAFGVSGVVAIMVFLGLGFRVIGLPLLVSCASFSLAVCLHPPSHAGLRALAGALVGLFCIPPVLGAVGLCRERWKREIRDEDFAAEIDDTIETLLGSDPGSVWVPGDPSGLRQAQAPDLVVPVESMDRLETKLGQLEGGTVAVCGPRGAGKSTLLAGTARDGDFSVLVQAPAAYAPHDFLLLLFTSVCERYITHRGYRPPRYEDLSRFRRMLRNSAPGARPLGRWTLNALILAMLAYVVVAGARGVGSWRGGAVFDWFEEAGHRVAEAVEGSWTGATPAGVLWTLLAAAALFLLSRTASLGFGARLLWNTVCLAGGLALVLWCGLDFLYDDEVNRHWEALKDSAPKADDGQREPPPGVGWLFLAGMALVGAVFAAGARADHADDRRKRAFATVSAVVLGALGVLCAVLGVQGAPRIQAILLDRDNLPRAALLAAGVLLLRLTVSLRPAHDVPDLIQECRTQLLRLKTVQTATTTLTTSVAPLAVLGSQHGAALTSVPPRYPELVEDFRGLLSRIAEAVHADGKRVVIAVDELDRLGSDTRALEFLGEIKPVLGLPHVHFLLAVAEDVGAAFVRRGLPHRDVTDSSLDDVLHIQPCTLDAARTILQRRAPGIPDPYILLAHALSGGVPRDLIRYTRRIVEMQQHTDSRELANVCRRLVVEELADTLAGFRTLLAKQEWSARTGEVLTRFRTLTSLLRTAVPAADTADAALHAAVQEFAFHPVQPEPDIPEGAVRLIEEASAYTYLALTLLDVFTPAGFDDRRRAAAERGPDGNPELLAEARQELALSPHSARPLLDSVRTAWNLGTPGHGSLHAV
ncbi:P-loop NTPase fold protein [Streptomyces sp. NPDC051940]|uniref:P-loop NTPase fold protein n=1 Tax=Streptomyces sp. NPDC051940 TaxID=3155675 RepID=UPI0034123037